MFSLWQLTCWVLICLLFAFWALIIIVIIHQLVLLCQYGVTIHGPIWHYLYEVGHFHCMMDEHILEHSSFGAFCISVCSLSHAGAYLVLREHQPFNKLSFTFGSSCWPLRVAYWGIPSFPRIIRPCTCFIIFWSNCRSLWVVILGHIPSYWVCLHCYPGYPLALGHLIKSPSCHFSLSRDRTYIDRSSFVFSLSRGHTYIDRSSSYHFHVNQFE